MLDNYVAQASRDRRVDDAQMLASTVVYCAVGSIKEGQRDIETPFDAECINDHFVAAAVASLGSFVGSAHRDAAWLVSQMDLMVGRSLAMDADDADAGVFSSHRVVTGRGDIATCAWVVLLVWAPHSHNTPPPPFTSVF